MDSSISPKDEIWFLRVRHHISNVVYSTSLYPCMTHNNFSLICLCLNLLLTFSSIFLPCNLAVVEDNLYIPCFLATLLLLTLGFPRARFYSHSSSHILATVLRFPKVHILARVLVHRLYS